MNTLYILRGVSGSGKTTLATTLEAVLPNGFCTAADDYFTDDKGNYNFNLKELGKAHKWCQNIVRHYMMYSNPSTENNLIVHNTFTTEAEMQPYLDLADEFGYKVVSLIVENRHGNTSVHNVPQEVLDKQAQRLINNIKLA